MEIFLCWVSGLLSYKGDDLWVLQGPRWGAESLAQLCQNLFSPVHFCRSKSSLCSSQLCHSRIYTQSLFWLPVHWDYLRASFIKTETTACHNTWKLDSRSPSGQTASRSRCCGPLWLLRRYSFCNLSWQEHKAQRRMTKNVKTGLLV